MTHRLPASNELDFCRPKNRVLFNPKRQNRFGQNSLASEWNRFVCSGQSCKRASKVIYDSRILNTSRLSQIKISEWIR